MRTPASLIDTPHSNRQKAKIGQTKVSARILLGVYVTSRQYSCKQLALQPPFVMMNRWQNTIGILLATTSSHLALRTSGWNGRCLDHRSSQLSASVLALKNAKTTIRNMNAQAMEKDKDEDAFDENPIWRVCTVRGCCLWIYVIELSKLYSHQFLKLYLYHNQWTDFHYLPHHAERMMKISFNKSDKYRSHGWMSP